eukprot:CAMPEP_0181309950 /NCGR_PEP_ID=MMETSP1101-20121128/12303_1 /TAXON_ID=46948 /ORGANISM="Rhodomonas abbreviata, Strain Caron Lab Isolate" /LENGTH=340 /DNA_ID=CAMNT_0023416501 /DNA_START=69 /DNA_END=1091 /DNA_ORIENTATION=+
MFGKDIAITLSAVVCLLAGSSIASTPTATPTSYGDTPLGSTECLEWVLGYSRDSCDLTCSRVSRGCTASFLDDIVTAQAFDDLVNEAHYLRSDFTGTSAELCTEGINVYNFAGAPAVFTYQLYMNSGGDAEGHLPAQYCNYPTSLSFLTGDCSTKYVYPPSQRFCPCTLGDCSPTAAPTHISEAPTLTPTATPTGCYHWIVGYSEQSCTQTCSNPEVGGTCSMEFLQLIDNRAAFDAMVAEAFMLGETTQPTSTALFCGGGVNPWTFAGSPAAFAYQVYVPLPSPHFEVDHYCNYPDATGLPPTFLTGDCDTTYTAPPSQRFCPCAIPDCTIWDTTHPDQ